jgi:hypothetical protein
MSSQLSELAFDAADHLYNAAQERGEVPADVDTMIGTLNSQASRGAPELPATIGKAAQMLAGLESQPSTV